MSVSIEKSKKTTLSKFIYGLGIRFVGEQTAKSLAEHFLSIESFLELESEEILKVPDIGPKVAESVLLWTQKKENKNYRSDKHPELSGADAFFLWKNRNVFIVFEIHPKTQ